MMSIVTKLKLTQIRRNMLPTDVDTLNWGCYSARTMTESERADVALRSGGKCVTYRRTDAIAA